MSYSDTMNKELWNGVSTGQFIGLVIGCAVALVIMCFMGSTIIGWFLAALVAYLIPHLFHTTHKEKAVYGAVTCVLILLVGGLEVDPQSLEGYKEQTPADNDYFSNITVTYDDSAKTLNVKADVTYGEKTGLVPVIGYTTVTMIVYSGLYTAQTTSNMPKVDFTSGDYTFTDWNTKDLHYLVIGLATASTDGDGNTTYSFDGSTTRSLTDAKYFSGDSFSLCWGGAAYAMAFFGVMFFFVLFCSWFFRKRMSRTRAKMEDQGRLYPQGYGRCEKCGAIVLPGEVECRKCGTYIDRPDELRHRKVDYFRCTNCGAEVPKNADKCPKCGAVFEGEETEVINTDGTIECPDCGTAVPRNADGTRICPRCGRRFQE